MDTAEEVLRRGRSMVVFPEGTRSMTGEMADFLPSLGYLALRAEVGILPAHIAGSLRGAAQGRGGAARARRWRCRSGRSSPPSGWPTLTDGLLAQEAWRLVAAFTQRVVENLRDGVATRARRRRRARRLGRPQARSDRRARQGAAAPRAPESVP